MRASTVKLRSSRSEDEEVKKRNAAGSRHPYPKTSIPRAKEFFRCERGNKRKSVSGKWRAKKGKRPRLFLF